MTLNRLDLGPTTRGQTATELCVEGLAACGPSGGLDDLNISPITGGVIYDENRPQVGSFVREHLLKQRTYPRSHDRNSVCNEPA